MPHNPQLPHASMPVRSTFTRIPDAVLLDDRITALQLRIYAVIARRVDRQTASAFPSYATIASDAHISRTSAITGVAALVTYGYLSKQSQSSGQGDATSNLYTVTGEGSEIFAPPHAERAQVSGAAVQVLHHGDAAFVRPVVQSVDHGGAIGAPESDSPNQKQRNKTQENRVALARTHQAAAASTDSELQVIYSDFQENIGPLTSVARHVIGQFLKEHSASWVRDAIQEAVIYEKRSLAYMRRVLRAWQRNGRATERSIVPVHTAAAAGQHDCIDSTLGNAVVWPPCDRDGDLPAIPYRNESAAMWDAICKKLPQLGRLPKLVTPISLVGDVLTISTSDARTYSVITDSQRHVVDFAVQCVMSDRAVLRVERAGEN